MKPPASIKRRGEPETAENIARDLIALAIWADLANKYQGDHDGTAKLWLRVKAAVADAGEHAGVALHMLRQIRMVRHYGADRIVEEFADQAKALARVE